MSLSGLITIQVEQPDGRIECIVPEHVVSFGETLLLPPESLGLMPEEQVRRTELHPTITLTSGTVVICKRVQCPPEVRQAVAMQTVFLAALDQLGTRIARRQALVGG